MKIEVGESLGYSYLRHVKQCWLVQANWKASEHWPRRLAGNTLDAMFADMRARFDPDGSVFRRTANAAQFLRQAEIDVIGVDWEGGVHALDIAFHEAGLNYGGGADKRVLKKLLRAMLILNCYHPPETKLHIYFLAPKVNPGVQETLEAAFTSLRGEYPAIEWKLIINDDFYRQVVWPTLEKAATVADTSELFVRSAKLLHLAEAATDAVPAHTRENRRVADDAGRFGHRGTATTPSNPARGRVQPLVQDLMRTLLEDYPTLLDDTDVRNLLNQDYCKINLGLQIGNHALLRRVEDGRKISGRDRYWKHEYAGECYVCSQWWKAHHVDNAKSLLRFVEGLIERMPDHPGILELKRHRQALRDYIG